MFLLVLTSLLALFHQVILVFMRAGTARIIVWLTLGLRAGKRTNGRADNWIVLYDTGATLLVAIAVVARDGVRMRV